MFRKMTPFLLISFICPGKCFTKFKRDFVRDNNACVDYAFVRPDTRLSKCAVLCATNSECKRFFSIPEDNSCMGCSTFESQPSQASISIVPWNHLTYRYLGCYTDYTNGIDRTLEGLIVTLEYMSSDICFKYCVVDRGYHYFATQSYTYCLCGNSHQGGSKRQEVECNTPCSADQSQMCGGLWMNSLYESY